MSSSSLHPFFFSMHFFPPTPIDIQIGDDGARAIGKILMANTSITDLDLNSMQNIYSAHKKRVMNCNYVIKTTKSE